jgi:hypothetical protein
MKYMLTLIGEEGGWEDATPEQMKEEMDRWAALSDEMFAAGAYIAGEALQPSQTATTLRIGEGEDRIVSDGPYAETKEQVGGFYLLECENLDEALEWGKKVPVSGGSVEVRPVMDFSDMGYEDPATRAQAST